MIKAGGMMLMAIGLSVAALEQQRRARAMEREATTVSRNAR